MALYDDKGKYIGVQDNENVVSGFLKGVVKGAGSTIGNLAKGALSGAGSAMLAPASPILGVYSTLAPAAAKEGVSSSIESLRKQYTTPTTTAQKAGFATEQIGEMFVPLGLESKVTSAIPGIAGRALGSGLEYGAKTFAQTGGDIEETAKVAAGSALIPVVLTPLKALGRAVYKVAIPLSQKEAVSVQAYRTATPFFKRVGLALSDNYKGPITAEETAFQKQLVLSQSAIGVQANRASKNIWSRVIKPAIDTSDVKVSMNNFWKSIKQAIVERNPELSRQKDLLQGLEALKSDYKGINKVNLKDIQGFKEGWAKFLPEKVYQGKNIAGAFGEVKNIAASTARNILYRELGPEVKAAYIDYGNLKNLAEMGQKAMTGGKLKGGFGGFWSAIKDIAIVPVGTVGGLAIYKAAGLFEFIGKPGAKTIYDLFFKAD